MRIATRSEWSIETGTLLFSDWFEWSGTVALMKGDSTLKQSEKAQAAFQQQLMGIFSQQFASNKGITDFLSAKLKPMITNPTGFDESTLTAMRTGAREGVTGEYEQAQKAVNAQRLAQGGPTSLPSGVDAQIQGSLAGDVAREQAGAQRDISLQDAQLKQANLWNSINALSGNAAQINPLGYAGQATSAGAATGSLGEAYNASKQSGWMNALAGGIGGGLTAGISNLTKPRPKA